MNVAKLNIELDREKIAAFCRRRGIRKLSLFGSVLRDDFDPERSDVDVLIELSPDTKVGLAISAGQTNSARSLGERWTSALASIDTSKTKCGMKR